MKKILLSLALFAISGYAIKGFSQTGCSGGANNCALAITNSVVTITNTTVLSPTQCEYTLTIEFDLSYNSGNKDIFIHSWLANDYPSYFPCASGSKAAPTNAILGTAIGSLGKSFLDISLDNGVERGAVGVPVPVTINTTYSPDANVVVTSPSNSPGMSVTKSFISGTTDHFVIAKAKVIVNQSCNNSLVVKTDVWSRNGSGPAQCWVAGIRQGFNDPSIAGFMTCSTPRTYTLGITTGETTPSTLTYSVWIDMDSNGLISNGDIEAVGPVNYLNFSNSNPFSTGGPVQYAPYSSQVIPANKQLIIEATTNLIGNSVNAVFKQPEGCAPLPVQFKSFNASRTTSSNVAITWTTAMEQNSKGFNVQKNVGGEWKTIAFVFSQAEGGNSSSELSYSFKDVNNEKGITQYRIQQVDLDGMAKYSDIKAIRGESAASRIVVYPNPSVDGKLNVVFEDNSGVRDVQVADMQGRIVKAFKGITNNILVIEKLTSGFYTIKVTNRNTAASTVEKVVVK